MSKCCYGVLIILFIIALICIIPNIGYDGPHENETTPLQTDFNLLDINGDGYLTFDEAKNYKNNLSEDLLLNCFNQADKNGNHLLKGGEFTYYTELVIDSAESEEKTDDENSFSSDFNSKSNSNYESNSNYKNRVSPEHEFWEEVEVVGYDSYGVPIYVCMYYTSGDKYFKPGTYTAIGNDYSGWDYEFENSDWKQMYRLN